MTAENPVAPESFGRGVGQTDPVEAALARALDAAVAAGRLDGVAAIVEELRARRLAAESNVVRLENARHRRHP
jgi:hypothetical protein